MTSANQHPIYGSYDRYLFGQDGSLLRNAVYIDGRKVMFRVNSNYIDFDHMAARHEISNPADKSDNTAYPIIRVEEGVCEVFDYNVCAYIYKKLNNNTRFSLISRWDGSKFNFWGGVSTLAIDLKGHWIGITKSVIDAYMQWSLATFYNIPDGYGSYYVDWLNSCRTSANMQESKSVPVILAEARKQKQEIDNLKAPEQLMLQAPVQEAVKEEPKVEPLEPDMPPVPVPLEGWIGNIDKVPDSVLAI